MKHFRLIFVSLFLLLPFSYAAIPVAKVVMLRGSATVLLAGEKEAKKVSQGMSLVS